MNTAFNNLYFPVSNLPEVKASQEEMKVISFAIGKLNCAIHLFSVYKVVNSTRLYGKDNNWVNIMHVGDREIVILDLRRRLFPNESIDLPTERVYVIVLQNAQGDLYGIPVTGIPAIMQIPIEQIRVLPETFRQANALGIASHVAVIPQGEGSLTLFLLDVELLFDLEKLLAQ